MEPRTKVYCIEMPPIPWQRARLAGKRFYNAQKAEKLTFGFILSDQHNREPLFSKPVSLDVTFYMQQPESWSGKKKDSTYVHSSKPDLDNLCKFLLDSLKGVLIQDDNIICEIKARKIYDKKPRTEFIITENLECHASL